MKDRLRWRLAGWLAVIVLAATGAPAAAAGGPGLQTPDAVSCNPWTGGPHIYVSPTYVEDQTLFATTGKEVNGERVKVYLKSTDRGLTLREMPIDPLFSYTSDMAFSPTYAADHTLCIATNSSGGSDASVVCSHDAGETWSAVSAPHVGGFRTLALADSRTFFLGIGGGPPFYYANQGLYRSADGGQTWRRVFAADVYSVAASPQYDADRLVLIAPGEYHYNEGVWRSDDGGETWQESNMGLEMAGDPTDSIRFSPDYGRDQTVFALDNSSVYGGLFKSTDQGRRWMLLETIDNPAIGIAEEYILSPRYGQDRTLWIKGSRGNGVSTDGGATWRGLAEEPQPEAAAPYCTPDGRCGVELFAVRYDIDVPIQVYRSLDSGQTWRCLEAPIVSPRGWLPLMHMGRKMVH